MSRTFPLFGALVLLLCLCTASPCMAQRFVDNNDGTVSDTKTGLMWSALDNQGDISWTEAKQWVQFTYPLTIPASYDNWRMPTLAELEALYDEGPYAHEYETACGINIAIHRPFQLTCGFVWTSEAKNITARLFSFQRGYSYMDRKTKRRGFRVLAVRETR